MEKQASQEIIGQQFISVRNILYMQKETKQNFPPN